MRARKLAIPGAVEFIPDVYPDERGLFLSPLEESAFTEAVGHPFFHVAQVSYSESRAGVVRGPHYTRTPPGMAKYVYCPRGAVIDVVLDTRVGSPTFGQWDAVRLDARHRHAVYFPVGVAHQFIVIEDSVMCYVLSLQYRAENELALSAHDERLGLPLPDGVAPLLSARDTAAPTLAEALAAGLLPGYEESLELERHLGEQVMA
uniref:DacS4 n=1 Tax=Dactylosporangium sp. SC14051 TaxID=1239282 RepID=K4IA50_9ACTN|nr:DacS4 [Dactylosporangium sp. SC14051]